MTFFPKMQKSDGRPIFPHRVKTCQTYISLVGVSLLGNISLYKKSELLESECKMYFSCDYFSDFSASEKLDKAIASLKRG